MSAADAAAFAALEAIQSGEWDRYLLRLRAAIEQRRKTDEWKATLIAGGEHECVFVGEHCVRPGHLR